MFLRRRRLWTPLGVALALLAFGAVAADAATHVLGARIGAGKGTTRLVLDLSAKVGFAAFTLANPYRVVVDLPPVTWRLDPLKSPKGGLVKAFRYGHFRDTISRVVLDVSGPVAIDKAFLLPPKRNRGYRLVVDLRAVGAAEFARRALPRRASEPPPETESIPLPKRRILRSLKTVAIDPGHGGVDPGAIGARGTREKRVTLSHALALARQLRATGRYRVVVTRGRDVFVPLRRRVAIARRHAADLFISLHADSIRSRKVRGASVYTLSERASDRRAAALAAKENKADLIAGIDLTEQTSEVASFLIDLARRQTMNDSAAFARILTREIGTVRTLLRNTHRFAGFAVLKAPDVPSVLVELGYLSNPAEERSLNRKRDRDRTAAAIVRAVDSYFAREQAFKR